jgi:hypothetical protein
VSGVSVSRASHLAAAGAWLAYFLVPTAGGWIDGIPAGPLDAAGIALVVWIAAHGVRLYAPALIALAVVVFAAATAAVPGHPGFQARQFANATATGAHERGTEHRGATFTRIDRELDFAKGRRDVPLAFFNDNSRFNFYRGGEPQRHLLEFSITWTGWWRATGSRTLYLHTPEASAQLFINGALAVETSPQQDLAMGAVTLPGDWQRIHIIFLSPYSAPRHFSAGELDNETMHPFTAESVRTQQLSAAESTALSILGVVKKAADIAALAWLLVVAGLLVVRRLGEVWQGRWSADRAAIALVIAAGAVEAMRYALPWTRQLLLLAGGDDPMTYEGYARDIQFNGILMNGGRPPGEGEPFYYQAFYPYFLAATHAIFGEDMFGVLLMQRFLVVLTAVAIMRIAIDLGGRTAWAAALVVGGLFTWWKFAPIAADLLNESLYLPLLMAWTAVLIRACRAPAAGGAAVTGLAAGFAAITRSTSILSWPIVWLLCAWQWRQHRGWVRFTMLMVGCSLAVFSLIALRNWIVAHEFAATSTELGITLLGGNEPPPDVIIDMEPRRAIYERFGLNPNTARVVEFALTAPQTFAAGIARKAAFALGFYEPYAPGWGYSPVYIAVWISAVAGFVVALRRRLAPPIAVMLPLLIALTQYAAVVIVYPKGERLILPIHTLLAPYAAIAAHALLARRLDQGAAERDRQASS